MSILKLFGQKMESNFLISFHFIYILWAEIRCVLYKKKHTLQLLWIRLITILDPQARLHSAYKCTKYHSTQINFKTQNNKHERFITCNYITYIILTEIIIMFNSYGLTTQITILSLCMPLIISHWRWTQ
jgi:hypothetical protein